MPPCASPFSNGAPAKAARSPSPEQSMKTSPRMATRPDFVSISSASMCPRPLDHDADGERVEQRYRRRARAGAVGRAFIGGGVVGLRAGLAEHQMRLVQAAESVDAREQIVGDAVHHLLDLAEHIGVQPAEIGHAGGGAHAAEEAVALDQHHLAAVLGGRRRGGDAGRAAAKHDDLVIAGDRGLPLGFGQERRRLRPSKTAHAGRRLALPVPILYCGAHKLGNPARGKHGLGRPHPRAGDLRRQPPVRDHARRARRRDRAAGHARLPRAVFARLDRRRSR